MASGIRGFLVLISIIVLLFASVIESYGGAATATIEYVYDEVGNIVEKKVTYTADIDPETISIPNTPSGQSTG